MDTNSIRVRKKGWEGDTWRKGFSQVNRGGLVYNRSVLNLLALVPPFANPAIKCPNHSRPFYNNPPLPVARLVMLRNRFILFSLRGMSVFILAVLSGIVWWLRTWQYGLVSIHETKSRILWIIQLELVRKHAFSNFSCEY